MTDPIIKWVVFYKRLFDNPSSDGIYPASPGPEEWTLYKLYDLWDDANRAIYEDLKAYQTSIGSVEIKRPTDLSEKSPPKESSDAPVS